MYGVDIVGVVVFEYWIGFVVQVVVVVDFVIQCQGYGFVEEWLEVLLLVVGMVVFQGVYIGDFEVGVLIVVGGWYQG